LLKLQSKCSHCGAREKKILGRCKFCFEEVCEGCGNIQVVQGINVVVHNKCLSDNLKHLSPVFKIFRLKE
jgi:hypothetical protein